MGTTRRITPTHPMHVPFELTAAAAEDPRLTERLRAEPAESRVRLLAEADRLARGGEEQRHLATLVYCALADDVDPARPDGARRVEWTVRVARPRAREARALLARAAAAHPDEDVRLRAASLDARIAEDDGEMDAAAAGFGKVARGSGGRRDDVEIAARLGLAEVAARHEEFASALGETVACLGGDAPSRVACVQVRRMRGCVFALLADPGRCERELLAAEAQVPRLPPAEVRAARSSIAAVRLCSHLAAGEPGRAIAHLRDALEDGGDTPAARRCEVHVAAATALLALGRTGDAAVHVARALRSGAQDPRLVVETELLQVRLQHTAGGAVSSRVAGARLVRHLAGDGRRATGPARRARIAMALHRMLAEAQGDADAAASSLDIAAAAAQEAVHRTPEAPSLPADDAAAITALRGRLAALADRTFRAAAVFLEATAARSGATALSGSAADAGRFACCPWCRRVRVPGSSWALADEAGTVPDLPDLALGACGDCAPTVARRLAVASPAR